MHNRHDYTSIGEGAGRFLTTQWTEIMSVRTSDRQRKQYIINKLISKYWKPVYCTIRRKGYCNEDAKDLTQSFFEEIVLNKELIKKADRTKGRFRTFLLTALDHFIINANQKKNAKKRKPDRGFHSFEIQEELDMPSGHQQMSAEDMFNYTWACELLSEVFERLENECIKADKRMHWTVFQQKILSPIIDSKPSPSMSELCKKYDIKSPQKASNMIVTVKRMFCRLLESHLALYAKNEKDAKDELNQLLQILSK
jgi:RNA polymerase sigma-70 factor (ECF subfamily)